jgi:hypothetical protein
MKIFLYGNKFAPELTGIGKYTGAWRDEAFRVTQLPWQLSKVAHFVGRCPGPYAKVLLRSVAPMAVCL